MLFDPSWVLQMGEQQTKGIGLLHKTLWPLVDDFDLFTVTMNGTQLIVLPKEAKIMQNLKTLWHGGRGKLIWHRTMQLVMGDGAPKSQCAHYGIGVQVGDRRIGYRLYPDGRVAQGF